MSHWNPGPGHPCSGHPCDGCATCRSGSCCSAPTSTVATTQVSARQVSFRRVEALTKRTAIDALEHTSLRALVAQDAAQRVLRKLPIPPPRPLEPPEAFRERDQRPDVTRPRALPAPAVSIEDLITQSGKAEPLGEEMA